jgi:signal transduction histidine kinase
VFEIEDRGIGIEAADQKHLFTAFQRGKNVGAIPGTGLGLVIVKRCVDLHGGMLTFESRVNEGTRFTVRVALFAEKNRREQPRNKHREKVPKTQKGKKGGKVRQTE